MSFMLGASREVARRVTDVNVYRVSMPEPRFIRGGVESSVELHARTGIDTKRVDIVIYVNFFAPLPEQEEADAKAGRFYRTISEALDKAGAAGQRIVSAKSMRITQERSTKAKWIWRINGKAVSPDWFVPLPSKPRVESIPAFMKA